MNISLNIKNLKTNKEKLLDIAKLKQLKNDYLIYISIKDSTYNFIIYKYVKDTHNKVYKIPLERSKLKTSNISEINEKIKEILYIEFDVDSNIKEVID